MAIIFIRDIRRLVFPTEAVLEAVLEFDRARAGNIWRATVLEAELVADPDPMLIITIRPTGSEPHAHHSIDSSTIAAAIIRYCSNARIPLPRQGKKTLDATSDGIALTIESTVSVARVRRAATITNSAVPPAEDTPEA